MTCLKDHCEQSKLLWFEIQTLIYSIPCQFLYFHQGSKPLSYNLFHKVEPRKAHIKRRCEVLTVYFIPDYDYLPSGGLPLDK